MTTPLITVEDLTMGWEDVNLLEDVSFEVQRGEVFAILGGSGCGKSTLLYLIGGFLPIETGTITVDGVPVSGPAPDRGGWSPWQREARWGNSAGCHSQQTSVRASMYGLRAAPRSTSHASRSV